jgi:hypothetical protein
MTYLIGEAALKFYTSRSPHQASIPLLKRLWYDKGVTRIANTKRQNMATITLELPDELVQEARELGIFEQETIIGILRQEVDERVMALVNREVHAYRAEKPKFNLSKSKGMA